MRHLQCIRVLWYLPLFFSFLFDCLFFLYRICHHALKYNIIRNEEAPKGFRKLE